MLAVEFTIPTSCLLDATLHPTDGPAAEGNRAPRVDLHLLAHLPDATLAARTVVGNPIAGARTPEDDVAIAFDHCVRVSTGRSICPRVEGRGPRCVLSRCWRVRSTALCSSTSRSLPDSTPRLLLGHAPPDKLVPLDSLTRGAGRRES